MSEKEIIRNIRLANDGNQKACKAIYDSYMPYCYGICIRYGIVNHQIKDILQIVFSSVFTSLDSFDSNKSAFKTWISRITIHKILDYKKSIAKRDPVLPIESVTEKGHYQESSHDLDKDYVFHILSDMPKKFQDVFNLFIIDGYSHKEIAKTLDITEISSRTKLMRGREWAKGALSHYLTNSVKYGQ